MRHFERSRETSRSLASTPRAPCDGECFRKHSPRKISFDCAQWTVQAKVSHSTIPARCPFPVILNDVKDPCAKHSPAQLAPTGDTGRAIPGRPAANVLPRRCARGCLYVRGRRSHGRPTRLAGTGRSPRARQAGVTGACSAWGFRSSLRPQRSSRAASGRARARAQVDGP